MTHTHKNQHFIYWAFLYGGPFLVLGLFDPELFEMTAYNFKGMGTRQFPDYLHSEGSF